VRSGVYRHDLHIGMARQPSDFRAEGEHWQRLQPRQRRHSLSNGGTPSGSLFGTSGLALSSANLYSAVQPGGSLYGLQQSNPVDTLPRRSRPCCSPTPEIVGHGLRSVVCGSRWSLCLLRRCSCAGRCWLVRHQSLTAASERAKRLLAVVCRTESLPFRVFPHAWVKPRKSNGGSLQSGGVPPRRCGGSR
jgi:hypothetical protein